MVEQENISLKELLKKLNDQIIQLDNALRNFLAIYFQSISKKGKN